MDNGYRRRPSLWQQAKYKAHQWGEGPPGQLSLHSNVDELLPMTAKSLQGASRDEGPPGLLSLQLALGTLADNL